MTAYRGGNNADNENPIQKINFRRNPINLDSHAHPEIQGMQGGYTQAHFSAILAIWWGLPLLRPFLATIGHFGLPTSATIPKGFP